MVEQSAYEKTPQNVFVGYFRKKRDGEIPLEEILDCKDCGIKHQRVGCGMEEKGKSDLVDRLYYSGPQQNKDDVPYLIGADLDQRGWYVTFNQNRYFRTNFKSFLRKDEIVYFNETIFKVPEKIVWRQTSDRPRASIIGPHWFANTLQAGVLKDTRYDLKYVLGLLNSRFLNFLYIESVKEAGRVFPQIKLGKLKGLPFKAIDFNNRIEREKHVQVAISVKKMLDLHERLHKVKTDHERTVIKCQIDATDWEIDRLVYELYGLTEEEIRLVEEATK